MTDGMLDVLWQFARGDMRVRDFELWLYEKHEDPALTATLGNDLFFALLDVDYCNRVAVSEIRRILLLRLQVALAVQCRCSSWCNYQILPMGYDSVTHQTAVLEDFFDYSVLVRRTPWLECVECRQCHQAWYLAVDTVDGDYHLLRLRPTAVEAIQRGEWPPDFDKLGAVWPDKDWLALFGLDSLEDWLSTQPPN